MTKNDLIELGLEEVDENEYSNGDMTIFIVDNDNISIIGDRENDLLCIPTLKCKTKKNLTDFLKSVYYDLQGKD